VKPRALDQTQARRGVDHFPRYRHAADQQHVGILDLLRQGPLRVELLHHKFRPEQPRDHLLDRQAWTGLFNLPLFAHRLRYKT
jgi:hypothetical protein